MARPESPAIVLNATDLTTAGRFSFTPLFFAQLCSDLESYPVSSAVTASSAVPIVFPTVRLVSHRGECEPPMPTWLATSVDDEPDDIHGLIRGQLREYVESLDGREYIHLLDGGVSDNLGLLNGVAAIAALGDPAEAMRSIGHENVRLILLVTVDAGSETERPWDRLDEPASPIQVVNGLSGAEIERNNELVTKLVRLTFGEFARDLSTPNRPVEFIHSEIGFGVVEDEEERSALRRIETSFNLSDTKVDLLISAGQRLVHESPGIRRATDQIEAGLGDR